MWKSINYSEEKLQEMVNMTIDNYGESESISHIEFVIHEYFKNPSGNAIVKLAYDEDNKVLAGQYVINPHKFYCFGQEENAALSLNTLTKKEYRGQGVFTGLANDAFQQAKEENFSFCYGAPNPNSHPGFIKKLGFSDLCTMPLFVRPLKVSQMVKEKTNTFLSVLCYPLNLFSLVRKVRDNNIVEIDEQNVQMMDDFWNSVSNKYRVIGIRDAKYIKYRYLNVPTRDYHPYVYLVEGKPVAFVASRIRKVANMTTGMIADFIFVDGYEKQAIKLIKYITKKNKELGAGLSGCIMLSHSREVKILKKAHFVKCPNKLLPQPTPLIIRIFDEKLIEKGIMDIKNWFFTTGDYDVV